MPLCAVPGCFNNGVHLFPKDPVLKKKWETAIRIKSFVATKHTRLCRDHFKSTDYIGESAYTGCQPQHRFLKKGTIPSIFPWRKHLPHPHQEQLDIKTDSRRQIDFSTADDNSSKPSCSEILTAEVEVRS